MNSNDFWNRGIPGTSGANPENEANLPVDSEDMLTVVPVTDEPVEVDDTFSLDKFQVVRREFFSHISEPSITFNNYKIGLNSACRRYSPVRQLHRWFHDASVWSRVRDYTNTRDRGSACVFHCMIPDEH